jgi:glycine/D-amino acid oxidase-like deaminating enzyme
MTRSPLLERRQGFCESLWYHTSMTPSASAEPQGAGSVDVVIIGGGITGLSAALHLAEAGVRVAVLEAADLGAGASGRNGGFVVPHFAKSDPNAVVEHLGQRGEALVELVGRSARALFDLIERLGIDCDARAGGWFQPAHSRQALAVIERRVREWAARGQPVRSHDAAETEQLTGCAGYLGSWSNASGGTLHPLKLVHGLARVASSRGARIFTHSEVTRLTRCGTQWRVVTTAGELAAQQVLVCTNALSHGVLPRLAQVVVPVRVYQGASERIPESWRRQLLRQGQSLSDTRMNLFTYRFDSEWRLITGMLPGWDLGGRARLAQAMGRRLQEMLGLPQAPRMEYIWHGEASIGPEFLPYLYEVETGVVAGTACNGRGIALSAQLGRIMAEGVRRGSWRDAPIPLRTLQPVRLRHLTRLGVRCYPLYGSVRARLERLAAKGE